VKRSPVVREEFNLAPLILRCPTRLNDLILEWMIGSKDFDKGNNI